MNEISTALLEPAPAPPTGGKEPPGPPDTPFATVLDDHQARTAVAEGHRRADEGASDDSALAALLGGVPLPQDARVAATSQAARGEPEPVGGRVLSPGEAFREPARGIVLTGATRPIGVPADATALPLRPVSADAPAPATAPSPSLPIGPDAVAADGRAAPPAAPAAAPRATRLADVLQAASARPSASPADRAVAPQPPSAAGRAQGGAGEPPAHVATPATPATPTSAPATPAIPPTAHASASAPADAPAVPVRPVGLEHAVETVRLALRHGAERGVTHARLSLTPRELGSIEVHLRQTADGLVARVVAEHATAAQQLQQAGAELRRSLEQQGLTLLRLDIGASGDEAGRRRGTAFDASGASRENRDGRRDERSDPLAPLDDAGEATTTLQLPNGALVDVLA